MARDQFLEACNRELFVHLKPKAFENLDAMAKEADRGSTVGFLLLQCSSGVVRHPRDLQVSVATHFCRVLIFASS